MTATLMERAQQAQAAASIPHINKWELFRELCVAKAAFEVTDRDLTVLNGLLSFHQDATLSDNDQLIVFPSNKALAERTHGMAESTLRRHLAVLVHSGLISRHDSPNGKRYASRDFDGSVSRAFGFDLRPLLVRGQEIVTAAAETRAALERMKRLREEVMLLKRDAIKLVAYGEEAQPDGGWEALQARLLVAHKLSRRVLAYDDLKALRAALGDILVDIQRILTNETADMSGNDVHNERHYQNSKPDSYESELSQRIGESGQGGDESSDPPQSESSAEKGHHLPLSLVVKATPDVLPYASGEIRSWHELIKTAGYVRGMMGISPDAWTQAQRAMGPEVAAITVVCILQRVSEINSPGGYLRSLSRKAEAGAFSPGPMVMALLNTDRQAA